jgi:hypothetical protein
VTDGTGRAHPMGADKELQDRLASYRPRGIDEPTWSSIRFFVRDCGSRLPSSGWSSTTRNLRAVSRLSAWANSEGIALEGELLLDPDTVERFVTHGLMDDPSRATYRAVLRRIGPLLTEKAPWEPRSASLARRQVASPYTPDEIEVLALDAGRQRTDARIRAAKALLALGAGAGLDGRWVARVTAEDISVHGSVVLVNVGKPSPRSVPILAHWESEVVQLASKAGDQFLVGGSSTSRNRASFVAASFESPLGHPRLSAARLRSTWLVWHLNAGTRLPELAAAAGLQGVTVVSDLLSAVPPMSEQDAQLHLRGASH